MQVEPFELADAAAGARVDAGQAAAARIEQVGEHLGVIAAAEAGELRDEPAIELFDDEAGQPVRLAEDEPARLARRRQAETVAAAERIAAASAGEEVGIRAAAPTSQV